MPNSYGYFKPEVGIYLRYNFPKTATVLDVGAGSGTYYNLLSDYFKDMSAVEVFAPYISQYDLKSKYKKVFNKDIVGFEYEFYDIIIFGDIIEHLSVEDARDVLEYAKDRCKEMIVAVPYQYVQGEILGNIYEIHKQSDLTPSLVLERYPFLELLYGNEQYGYYIKKKN